MAPRSPASAKQDAVNIIIKATEQGSETIKAFGGKLIELRGTADQVRTGFDAIGTAIVATSQTAISNLSGVSTIITAIKQTLDSQTGQQLLTDIQESAADAISQTQDLTDVLGSVKNAAAPALSGFFQGNQAGKIEQKANALGGLIAKNLTDPLQTKSQEISNQLVSNLFGKLPEQLAKQNLVSQGLSVALNTASQKIGSDQLVGKALESSLAFGLNKFIDSKLPPGIRQINQLMGGSLGNAFLPKPIQELMAGGDLFKSLETLVSSAISGGFKTGFEQVDSVVLSADEPLQALGLLVSQRLQNGIENGFSAPKISSLTPQLLAGLTSKMPEEFKGIFGTIINSYSQDIEENLKVLDEPFQKGVDFLIKRAAKRSGVTNPFKEKVFDFFKDLDQKSDGLLGDVGAQMGARLGISFAKGLSSQVTQAVGSAANHVDSLIRRSVGFVESIPEKLGSPAKAVSGAFAGIAGFDEPLTVMRGLQSAVGGVTQGIFNATQQISVFSNGLSALKGFVMGGPFELLIGQNVKLREQLLSTQSSLVATNKVFVDGQQIKDSGVAIQSLSGPINSAIAKLKQGSLELVGVTSNQLIDAFQIIAGQSAQIGINMTQAADLTLSTAAAMGTLGIPLYQARQEITSIISGTIDMNSVMAKSLGITNSMVAKWKSQGTFYDEFTKKLEAFRAGNLAAANSLSGISSNIQELFDNIGQEVGQPLLDPILKYFQQFYQYLNDNRETLTQAFSSIVTQLFNASQKFVDAFIQLYSTVSGLLSAVPEYLVKSLANAISAVADAITFLIPIILPAVNVMTQLAQSAMALGGPFLAIAAKAFILHKAISILGGGFGILSQTLPGVGELLFILTGRSSGLVNMFTSLSQSIGYGGAGFLLLGKNLKSIPMLVSKVTQELGFFGKMGVNLIPQIAGLGVTLVGMSKNFPALGTVFQNLSKQVPGLVGGFASLVSSSDFMGGAFKALAPDIQKLAQSVSIYANNIDNASFLNMKFAGAVKEAGAMARASIISFGLMGAGVFAALFIIDKFIVNNKNFVKGLEQLWTTVQNIGAAIYGFLTNPITVAIGVVTGLTIAVKAGLLPVMIDFMKTFAASSTAAIGNWWKTATGGIKTFSNGISAIPTKLKAIADGTENIADALTGKNKTQAAVENLSQENDKIEAEIRKRRQLIQEANSNLETLGSKDDGKSTKARNAAEQIRSQEQLSFEQLNQSKKDNFRKLAATNKVAASEYFKSQQEEFEAGQVNYEKYIASQEERVNQSQANLSKADPLKNSGQYAELKKARDQAQTNLEEVIATRNRQAAELGEMEKTLAQTVANPAQVKAELAKSQVEIDAAIAEREQTLQDLKGAASRIMPTEVGEQPLLKEQQILQSEIDDLYASREANATKMGQVEDQIAAKIKASPIVQAVQTEIVQLEAAIAERNALLAQLDSQQTQGDGFVMEDDGRDVAEKRNIAKQELDELTAARSAAGQKLKQVEADVLNPKALPTGMQAFSKNATEKMGGTIKQLEGRIKAFSGNTLRELGAALQEVGWKQAANKALEMGDGMAIASKGALLCEKAQKGLLPQVESSSLSFGQFKSAVGNAGVGLMGFAKGAVGTLKVALIELWATMGPALLFMGAIAAVTEAVGAFTKMTEASKTAADDYNSTFLEAQTTLENYSSLLGRLSAQQSDYGAKRLNQLRDEASWLAKFLDFVGNRKGKLSFVEIQAQGTLADEKKANQIKLQQADEYRAKLQKNWADIEVGERTLAQLRNDLAAANTKGDKYEIDRIQSKIDSNQKLSDSHKAALDQQIEYWETQQAYTPIEKKEYADQIALLKQKRQELEQIAEIKPPDLKRLGGVTEQLATKATAAMSELQRIMGAGAGQADQFEAKAKEFLELTDQQLKLGDITESEARSRYALLANNVLSSTDIQIKAQEGLTNSFKTEGEKQVGNNERQQSAIAEQVANGTLNQAEADRQLTVLKQQQLDTQLENAKASAQQQYEALESSRLDSLMSMDKAIAEQQSKIVDPALSAEDRAKAENDLAIMLKNQKNLVENFNTQRSEIDRNYQNEAQKIETEIAQNQQKAREQENQSILKDYEEVQVQLEAMKADGEITEEQFAQKRFENTRDRLTEESRIVSEQRAKLLQPIAELDPALAEQLAQEKDTMAARAQLRERLKTAVTQSEKDAIASAIQGLEELAGKEAEISKQRQAAQKELYDEQIRLADQARTKLLNAAKEAEIQADIGIQDMLSKGQIRKEKADQLKLDASQRYVKADLKTEQDRLRQLEAMPKYSDPTLEAQRQAKISESRQKTYQLTLSIAENEYRRQEMLRQEQDRLRKDRALQIENDGKVVIAGLKDQEQAIARVTKTIELQNTILAARQDLLDSNANMLNTQFDVLSRTTRSIREQKDLSRLKAVAEMQALETKQKGELEALKIQRMQTDLALEREKIENRIAQIKNQADVAKAEAEVARIDADPNATDAEKQASRLGLEATRKEGEALQMTAGLLDRQGEVNRRTFDMRLESTLNNQSAEMLNARTNVASTLQGAERTRAYRQIQDEGMTSLGLSTGLEGRRELSAQSNIAARNAFYSKPATTPGILGALQTGLKVPAIPNLSGSQKVPQSRSASSDGQFQLVDAMRMMSENLQRFSGIQFSQENQFTNNFSSPDASNGNFQRDLQQQLLNSSYDVLSKLQQRYTSRSN